jgi:hypothetical protein
MQDTAKMTRKPESGKPAPRPLVDEELADQMRAWVSAAKAVGCVPVGVLGWTG